MPKYLVKTPEGKYAEWSTIVDNFTDILDVMEVDIKNRRPRDISSHYTWGSCIHFMVIRHGLDHTIEAIREILRFPETMKIWFDYAREVRQNPDNTSCPSFPDIPHPLPPARAAKVLYLEDCPLETQAHGLREITEKHDVSRVIFIRCPEFDEENYDEVYTRDQWMRECMALIDMCDCVYFPDHRKANRHIMSLASYAQNGGKMVYTDDVLTDLIAYY